MSEDRKKWAEQMVKNAAKMKKAKPDDPLAWDSFGSTPEKKKRSLLARSVDRVSGFGLKNGLYK